MKKYYDIVVNFDEVMYYFYEWDENDVLEYIKSIPMIRVSKKSFKQILLNKIQLEEKEVEKIKNQTTFVNGKTTTALLITDTLNSFVLEFDHRGQEIGISTLQIEEELDITEMSFVMKNYDLQFNPILKRSFNTIGRKDEYIKTFITSELEELYTSKNKSKLDYFYLELFKKQGTSFEEAYQEMKDYLSKGVTQELYYIYDLMLLSHKKSGLSN